LGVKGLSHVAVGVSDMERALVFYRDLIGLRVTLDTVEGGFGGGLVGVNRRRAVYLRAADGPDAFFIVLDQQLDREPFGSPPRILQLGTHHFSFWVDNLEEIFERISGDSQTHRG
jgi:catechol 2,3-dioxygenase-like lactoylglutathione lyase family enzyme